MSETRKVRVILVEDHIAFRQALAFLLGREPDLEVVAQAGSPAQAREVLVDGHIDVAVVDLSLPDGDGRDLIGELRRRHSGIAVVVLSATIEAGHHEEVLKAVAGPRRDLITDPEQNHHSPQRSTSIAVSGSKAGFGSERQRSPYPPHPLPESGKA
jgi:chemotaxis response regulator CheB